MTPSTLASRSWRVGTAALMASASVACSGLGEVATRPLAGFKSAEPSGTAATEVSLPAALGEAGAQAGPASEAEPHASGPQLRGLMAGLAVQRAQEASAAPAPAGGMGLFALTAPHGAPDRTGSSLGLGPDGYGQGEPVLGPAAGAAYGVHLASYRAADTAIAGWQELTSAAPATLSGLEARLERVDLGAQGQYLRLKAGPLPTAADATAACATLAAQGLFCRTSTFSGAPIGQ